jgi:hypothetical protein
MTKYFYEKLLEEWCSQFSNEKACICVFEKVRDIPYGSTGARDPEIIVQNNLGSCSGKHVLLNNFFQLLGCGSKVVTCSHYFNDALPPENDYPKPLQEILQKHQVIDFHHFIKLKKGDNWLNVDATWDTPLKKYGFPVNLEWDGNSNTTIAVHPINFYPITNDIIALKTKLISELSPENRKIRSKFMQFLTDWLSEIRS